MDRTDKPGWRATYAVSIGRFHPYHLGHFAILKKMCQELPLPHLIIIVCHDVRLGNYENSGKNSLAYNPFSAWERATMIGMTVAAEPLEQEINWAFMPYTTVPSRAGISAYLPRHVVRCTTNKDAADLQKARNWHALGWETFVLDVSAAPVLSSSQLRREVAEGKDWRRFLHPSTHQYFSEIDGPERILKSVAEENA